MGVRKCLAILILVCVLISSVLASVALAADKKAESSAIGMVDLETILKEYEKKKTSDAEVQALIKSLQEKFDLRNRNKLLTEQEMTDLENLKFKDKPSAAEQAKVTELENLEKTKDSELKDLQSKKESTDADKARLAELQGIGKASDAKLAALAKEYSTLIENKRVELGNQITKEVLEAIKIVAQEKSIGTVVDKVAVLYGGVDITAPVLEKLNKKK